MTADEFVQNFRVEKDRMIATYFTDLSETAVGQQIEALGLTPEQLGQIRTVLDGALTDAFYTLLLGLDGCCSLGDSTQQSYRITSEDGSDISGDGGDIEEAAFRHFQDKSQ